MLNLYDKSSIIIIIIIIINSNNKKLMHKLRISRIVLKQASVYKNRFKTVCAHFWNDKSVQPVPKMPGPLWR